MISTTNGADISTWINAMRDLEITIDFPVSQSLNLDSGAFEPLKSSVTNLRFWKSETDIPIAEFCEMLKEIQSIRCIFTRADQGENKKIIRIYTLISRPNAVIQSSIYKAEMSIMRKYPQFDYDFNVIFWADYDIRAIQPPGMAIALERQNQ